MPQIMIRGMDQKDIQLISRQLVTELTECIGCPREYFTIELLPTISIADGEIRKGILLYRSIGLTEGRLFRIMRLPSWTGTFAVPVITRWKYIFWC